MQKLHLGQLPIDEDFRALRDVANLSDRRVRCTYLGGQSRQTPAQPDGGNPADATSTTASTDASTSTSAPRASTSKATYVKDDGSEDEDFDNYTPDAQAEEDELEEELEV